MSVGRICVRDVDTAEPHESVLAAAERMQERGIGSLIVLNAAQQPIGIVTDRDLTARVLARRRIPTQTPISEVMTSGPTTTSEDASIESGLALMRSGGFRRLPVVDRDGKLVGLLSLDDVLTLLAEEFNLIGQLLGRGTAARTP